MLPSPAARLCEAVVVKDYVKVAPTWSLRIAHCDRLPRQTLDQLAVFVGVVRGPLADTHRCPPSAAASPSASTLIPRWPKQVAWHTISDTRPPFGYNGEIALRTLDRTHGREFEANAQTLRILAQEEPGHTGDGLNLARAR